MADVTQILSAIEAGDPKAAAELLPLVYDELRKLAAARLAAEPAGHTLQPTALVHEAYLRLVGDGRTRDWNGRGHFFAAAAEAMRRVLINRARDKHRLKRGGGRGRVDLDALSDPATAPDAALIDLDDALRRLAGVNAQAAEMVKHRFFAGLTLHEAAAALGIPSRSGDRL
jgi:RNA polymerase sigma factor (TIGR02999 family)